VFPEVPLVALMELDLAGVDFAGVGLEPGDRGANLALRQWADLVAARRMVAGLTATEFQRSTYPSWLQPLLQVCHEGVDLGRCRPDPQARLTLADGTRLAVGDPVLSFASRCLEPLRGFPQLMAALPSLLTAHPQLRVVIVGGDGGGYGPAAPAGSSWRQEVLRRWSGPRERLHFTGLLAAADLIRLFQISRIHVYLTAPFVLSWSLLEAMACGALVVGSATAPVQEVIEPGRNGLLVPFGDAIALARQLDRVLVDPLPFAPLRLEARRTVVRRFDRRSCMARQVAWLERLAAGSP
jgi:glycosyltransferase involved in cell wall biosynthesis